MSVCLSIICQQTPQNLWHSSVPPVGPGQHQGLGQGGLGALMPSSGWGQESLPSLWELWGVLLV